MFFLSQALGGFDCVFGALGSQLCSRVAACEYAAGVHDYSYKEGCYSGYADHGEGDQAFSRTALLNCFEGFTTSGRHAG